jgi:UDP-galactopyranose mutase
MTDFFDAVPDAIRRAWQAAARPPHKRRVFFTGPVDRYFAQAGLPPLEYRSIRFDVVDLPHVTLFQPMVRAYRRV